MVCLGEAQQLMSLLRDIFTDEFMARFSSAVIANWNADILIYSLTLLVSFVRESTDFTDWDTMVRRATALRFHSES